MLEKLGTSYIPLISRPCDSSWRKTTAHGSRRTTARGGKRKVMAPGGQYRLENDESCQQQKV